MQARLKKEAIALYRLASTLIHNRIITVRYEPGDKRATGTILMIKKSPAGLAGAAGDGCITTGD